MNMFTKDISEGKVDWEVSVTYLEEEKVFQLRRKYEVVKMLVGFSKVDFRGSELFQCYDKFEKERRGVKGERQ